MRGSSNHSGPRLFLFLYFISIFSYGFYFGLQNEDRGGSCHSGPRLLLFFDFLNFLNFGLQNEERSSSNHSGPRLLLLPEFGLAWTGRPLVSQLSTLLGVDLKQLGAIIKNICVNIMYETRG